MSAIEVEPEMDGRRIELMRQALNGSPGLRPLKDLRRVVSLRDSNLIEVEDSDKEKTLCTLPPKLGQTVCIKIGNFLIVEESTRDQTAEAGRKGTRTIARLLSDEHVLTLRKSSFWPSSFQDTFYKARGGTEPPAPVDAPKAPAGQSREKEHTADESPAPVEVFKGLCGQNGEKARGVTECLVLVDATKAPVKGNGEKALGTAELPITMEAPRVPAEQKDEKVRVVEFSASVEISTALVEQNDEIAPGVTEPPAHGEAPKAPVENNGLKARDVKPPFLVEALKAPVERNGEKSQGSGEPPTPVEAFDTPGGQNGEKSRGGAEPAAPVKAPKPTAERNSDKVQGSSGLTAPMEAPKAMGEQNGQEARGGAEPLATVGSLKAPAKSNVQKPGGATKSLTPVEVPEAAVEQNSGDEEVDNGEKTDTDKNLSSLWTGGETNVSWEIVENQSVLGPGPLDSEMAAEHKPTPAKELNSYFMIKIPMFSDKKWKTEIRMAELRFKEVAEKHGFINAAMQMKKASRTEALHKLRTAREKARACADAIRHKREEMSPLQGALRKLRDTGRQARDKSPDLPASEQELDKRIAYCEYRIQHESIPLKEEKLLLREIKSLRASREVVCAKEALHAEFFESWGEREDIQERLKPLISELDSLKAEWTLATKTSKEAEAVLKEMDTALSQVQDQWTAANQARQDAYDERAALIRQENAQNNEFYQNRREIQYVRQLAFKKEKRAVEEICNTQVERVMSLWNSNVEFRAAYVISNEKSTLKRLQTSDGRALGPNEDPPLISGNGDNSFSANQMEVGPSVGPAKSQREGPVGLSHNLGLPTLDIQRNGKCLESPIFLELNGNLSSGNAIAGTVAFSKGQEEKEEEDSAAAANLKQKRREQEMAKARDAEERKRRSAQRLQSKTLARAKKEANRQEKEKEKRSQKNAARLSYSVQRITPSIEVGCGATQEGENALDVTQELSPKSGRICRYPKRPPPQMLRTIKTPLVSSFTKKDGIHLPVGFWKVGLLGLLAILALLAIFVL